MAIPIGTVRFVPRNPAQPFRGLLYWSLVARNRAQTYVAVAIELAKRPTFHLHTAGNRAC